MLRHEDRARRQVSVVALDVTAVRSVRNSSNAAKVLQGFPAMITAPGHHCIDAAITMESGGSVFRVQVASAIRAEAAEEAG